LQLIDCRFKPEGIVVSLTEWCLSHLDLRSHAELQRVQYVFFGGGRSLILTTRPKDKSAGGGSFLGGCLVAEPPLLGGLATPFGQPGRGLANLSI
jgi:hypothetical protein